MTRVTKGQPVKVKTRGRRIIVQYDSNRKPRILKLNGTVNDTRAHNQLLGATVDLLSEDSTLIRSLTATRRYSSDIGLRGRGRSSPFPFRQCLRSTSSASRSTGIRRPMLIMPWSTSVGANRGDEGGDRHGLARAILL